MAGAGPPHRLGGDVDAQDVGRARLRRRGGEVALPATEVEDALAATHVLEQERPPPLHVEPGQRVGSVLPERVVPRQGGSDPPERVGDNADRGQTPLRVGDNADRGQTPLRVVEGLRSA